MKGEESIEDSSDDEILSYLIASFLLPGTELKPPRTLDATPGEKAKVERDLSGAYQRLVNDYFCESPKYCESSFEKRF